MEFIIRGEYIELMQLLKACGIAQTGGEAAFLIGEGEVFCNDEVEFRKRRKLRPSDSVRVNGTLILLK